MTALFASLEASAFSTWIRESPSIWAYPAILTLHTMGLGVLVGANWMVDLRVLGFGRAIPLSVLSRAFPIMWAGFWVNAVSGVLLFIADTSKATTTVFMWKLALIAAGVALIIVLKKRLYARVGGADQATLGVRVMAIASLMLWVAAIGTGRWMAYTQEVSL